MLRSPARPKRASRVSASAATARTLDRIEESSALNAFIYVAREEALEEAAKADARAERGARLGALHGLPVAVKDVFDIAGWPTTNGLAAKGVARASEDAHVVSRLRRAGAIVVGKTNLHPLAYGVTGQNPEYGDAHNPWDPTRIAGGSSSGSAIAVAVDSVRVALGTDTGGSVRLPAALCGVLGFKPTFGMLSTKGMTPLAWSMDHVGILSQTAEDCALILGVLAGRRSSRARTSTLGNGAKSLRGIRVGIPDLAELQPPTADVADSIGRALRTLEKLGARLIELKWPLVEHAPTVASVVINTEASALHGALLKGDVLSKVPLTRRRIEAGYLLSGPDTVRAMVLRKAFVDESMRLMDQVDVIATPTSPVTAPRLGETDVLLGGAAVPIAILSQYTRLHNLTGFPAVSVPCDFSPSGLPIGIQLASRPKSDIWLLAVAHQLARALPPPMSYRATALGTGAKAGKPRHGAT
jgi:aspartyl-tRNA(Asn)/glutamyl-tRNA(Gln) amidotransferase subunit A